MAGVDGTARDGTGRATVGTDDARILQIPGLQLHLFDMDAATTTTATTVTTTTPSPSPPPPSPSSPSPPPPSPSPPSPPHTSTHAPRHHHHYHRELPLSQPHIHSISWWVTRKTSGNLLHGLFRECFAALGVVVGDQGAVGAADGADEDVQLNQELRFAQVQGKRWQDNQFESHWPVPKIHTSPYWVGRRGKSGLSIIRSVFCGHESHESDTLFKVFHMQRRQAI